MKIEEIPLPKQGSIQYKHSDRCCKEVKSFGTGYFTGRKGQCSRVARFKLDGVLYCPQHAGEMSLRYLIEGK